LFYEDRKILTENIKDALVSPVQRLRSLYSNPCIVDMCPRIVVAINHPAIGALPIYEEGMSDKMSLFKIAKSKRLPDDKCPRNEFEALIAAALPGLANHLTNELVVKDEYKEVGKNVRFNTKTYQHKELLEKILDVKRHVSLAEMIFKWWYIYEPTGSPLDIWSRLTIYDTESTKAIMALAKSKEKFGTIMTELAQATANHDHHFIEGVHVEKLLRGHSGNRYKITYDPDLDRPQKPNDYVAPSVKTAVRKIRNKLGN
jgi:hypothetical protein